MEPLSSMSSQPLTNASKLAAVRDLSLALFNHDRRAASTAAILMVGSALLEGFGLLSLVPIIGLIVSSPESGSLNDILVGYGLDDRTTQLAVLIGGFFVIALARAQVMHMRDVTLGKIHLGFARSEKNEIIQRLVYSSWDQLVAIDHARIQAMISYEVARAVSAAQRIIRIIVSLLLMAVNLTLAFLLAPDLLLFLVSVAGILLLLFWLTQRDAYALGEKIRSNSQQLLGSTQSLLSGLKTALAQEDQDWFVGQFEQVQEELMSGQLEFQLKQAGARRLFAVVSTVVAVAAVSGGMLLEVDPASLIVVVLIVSRMIGPTLQLQQGSQQLLFDLSCYLSITSLRGQLRPEERKAAAATLPRGDLELVGVGYRHSDGGGVGPLDLTLAEGEFLGVAGPSGGGKSTLIDVIAGLLEPQTGTIHLGGRELDREHLPAWKRQLSYLGQQVYLFNGSMRANLCWSEPILDETRIWEALDLVGLSALVSGLEQGLDTPLGEQGVLFSGGERQRIALARAILRKPKLLILDEATSAIDIASENELFQRLRAMPDRPTIILVAHRRESLSHCSRILQVEGGKIADSQVVPA